MREYILAVGSINMDLVIRTPHYPQPGETVLGGNFQTFPGGKGANQAVAAARLDANVLLIGKVGQDSFGDAMLQTIQNDRVDIQCIQRDPKLPTGVAFIIVDETSGQNIIVLAAGANSNVTPLDVAAYTPFFKQAKVLMMNLECPLPAIEKAVELAKQEQDIIVVLNPAPYRQLSPELLRRVDVLVPNQIEISQLLGISSTTADIQDIIRLVGERQSRGELNQVVITLGEKGALVIENGKSTAIPAHQVTPVDTVAAGDAFVGALSVALSEGKSLLEAAHWGNAAGALAVTKQGAQPSLPTRQALLDLLNSTKK